jgi:hypothetical protein
VPLQILGWYQVAANLVTLPLVGAAICGPAGGLTVMLLTGRAVPVRRRG